MRPSGQASSSARAAQHPRPESERRARIVAIDALRGFAVALMFVYHFCFDLNHFGAIRQDFNHSPFWLGFRALIVSLFLGLVGVGVVLGHGRALDLPRFLARLARIAGCALLVSIGSYAMFPQSFIFFGILHFIAVASVLALPFRRLGAVNLAIAAALLALPASGGFALFDHPALQWIGPMSHKPVTEDYVPLVPWFGVVLAGIALAGMLSRSPWWQRMPATRPVRAVAVLALAGRHSLLLYMIHQPLFIGALSLVLRPPA